MARGRESFLEGLARGYMTHQSMMAQKREEDRAVEREARATERQGRLDAIDAEDRGIRRTAAEQQGKLVDVQLGNAQREAARADQVAAAEKLITKAGVIGVEVSFVPGKKEGEQDQVFTVNGQQFQNRAAADAAAADLNTPLLIAKRRANAARETGVAELDQKYGTIYSNARTNIEQEFRQDFQESMRKGGVQGVVDLYNKQVKNGHTLVAQRGPNGSLTVGQYVGGKLQGDPVTYTSQQGGATAEEQFLAEQVQRFSSDPDKMLESFHRKQMLGENRRQFDASMGLSRDKLTQDATQFGEKMAWEREYGAGQLGIGRTNASANVAQAGTNVGVVRNPPKPEGAMDAYLRSRMPTASKIGTGGGIEINDAGLQRLDELMKSR